MKIPEEAVAAAFHAYIQYPRTRSLGNTASMLRAALEAAAPLIAAQAWEEGFDYARGGEAWTEEVNPLQDQRMTINEFLEARIAEDEAAAEQLTHVFHGPGTQMYVGETWIQSPLKKSRFLAECAAKRAIIAQAEDVEAMDYQITNEWGGYIEGTADKILYALASIYHDHPDYQREWAL